MVIMAEIVSYCNVLKVQKAFCAAVGMSTQHLSAVKSSELRNRRFHELGATKLAVLWVLDNLEG